jgi:1,4-dihydroxy-2-naphthoate octaprenyltransferase
MPDTPFPAPPSGLRLWLLAIRPKTLTIALVPVLVGSALAWGEAARLNGPAALAAALAAVLIQAATNLHNDAADFLRGGDTPARQGPTRVTAQGWATPQVVMRAAALSFAGAALCGLYVVWLGGWPLLAVGGASILAGWAYTGGPRPIAYTPLGELFVLLFFGLAAVMGSYWLHAHALTMTSLWAALAVGAPASAVLLVNNYRDTDNDRAVGRRTLPVVAGPAVTKAVYLGLMALPFLLLWPIHRALPSSPLWLPLFALPLALFNGLFFLREAPGPRFNGLLARTALLQVAYGVLLAIAVTTCGG